jgi:hypothetical protein
MGSVTRGAEKLADIIPSFPSAASPAGKGPQRGSTSKEIIVILHCHRLQNGLEEHSYLHQSILRSLLSRSCPIQSGIYPLPRLRALDGGLCPCSLFRNRRSPQVTCRKLPLSMLVDGWSSSYSRGNVESEGRGYHNYPRILAALSHIHRAMGLKLSPATRDNVDIFN